jgi:predicted nucleic acid-binding protein
VKLVVDANIVFSGILNSNGKIGDILINSGNYLELIAPKFLQTEISKYYLKLSKISGLNIEQIRKSEIQICKQVTFVSEDTIKAESWHFAHNLVENIDPNDTPYIAFSKHFNCKLWSGDKKLINGLEKKGFANNTNQ